jgi:hypothetical protein
MERSLLKHPFESSAITLCMLCLAAASGSAIGDVPNRVVSTVVATTPYSHTIWEQPPLEWDALSKTPSICGWDEPSYVQQLPATVSSSSSYAIDDFRCGSLMPITSIHWWGSYQGWLGTVLPTTGLPDAWQVTFYTTSIYDANKPGDEIEKLTVDPNRVSAEWVAYDRFQDKTADSCFRYSLTLNTKEYFLPTLYDGDVFWISIAAVYKSQTPSNLWGWKTRPAQWGAGAQKISSAYTVTPGGLPMSSIVILPVTAASPCGGAPTSYDMTFAFDTGVSCIKAEQAFTGLRDWTIYEDEASNGAGKMISGIGPIWAQASDTTGNGQNVDTTADAPKSWDPEIIADDFESRSTGPISLIMIWGAWYGLLPGGDPANADFVLTIRENLPPSGSRTYSMPGAVLWTKTFQKGSFSVAASNTDDQGYSSSAAGKAYSKFIWQGYQYSFPLSDETAFATTGTPDKPVIYWLSVQAQVTRIGDTTSRFGWKTSTNTSNGDAVWAKGQEPYTGTWQKWSYPATHARAGQATAMAFTLMTTSVATSETVDHEVADDWKSQGASPVAAATWWGSYLGYAYQPCACNTPPKPVKPTYFLLSIWSNVPDPNASNPKDFGHPGEKLWQYATLKYDEVMVGSDSGPADGNLANGREPVYRYSVTLPAFARFTPQAGQTYWFSVLAAYANPKAVTYPWGWTNHEFSFGSSAVTGTDVTDSTGKKTRTWQVLKDGTGQNEDMSFMLYQQGQTLGVQLD